MRVPIPQEEISKRLKEITKLGLKRGFDSSPFHIVITDDNANIIYANKAVQERTGFPVEEIIGKNPADLWGGNMPPKFYENMWRTIKIEKKPFVGDVQNKKKDGTSYWQELFIASILDEGGNVRFFIGIEPDITDKKQREQFKEQFISAVGHQVRNPLTVIRWILDNLLASPELREAERRELEKVYQQNVNLAGLIRDLLLLSKVENPAPQIETVKLAEEIESIISSVKQKHPDVSIVFENNAGSATLDSIRSLTLQVFSNIIYNASEHASEEAGKVIVKLEKNSQGLIFSCYNNGQPIPEEIKSQVFTKVISKTDAGLGLFIVKMISDYFGWRVSFDTGEAGTTFYVKIPYPNQ